MLRRARLTIIESGASATAWASCHALGADDWLVVAQQRDESAPAFNRRVRQRVQRLLKEGAQIESVDVYAGPENDEFCAAARREVVRELSDQMSTGGRFTLWSSSADAGTDAELAGVLTQLRPILADRQIAMSHQAWEPEQRSGIRHSVPERLDDVDSAFENFA